MRCPFYLSDHLEYCKEAATALDLIDLLHEKGNEDLITFFEDACKDETWTLGEGKQVMQQLTEELTRQSFRYRLPSQHRTRAAQSIRKHFTVMDEFLPRDINIQVEESTYDVNSLLFIEGSEYFHELIRREFLENKRKSLLLTILNDKQFKFVQEFFQKGTIDDLWKEGEPFLYQFLLLAKRLNSDPLMEFTAEIYKRYLNRTNVMEHFLTAQKEGILALEEICARQFEEENFGFTIRTTDNGLHMTLDRLRERMFDWMKPILPQVTSIQCSVVAGQSDLPELIAMIPKLEEFDISGSKEIHPELIDALPLLKSVNLSDCDWLTDDLFLRFLQHSPNLNRLILHGVNTLSHRSWGALGNSNKLRFLELDRSALNNDELDLIVSSCPGLLELSLKDCDWLSNEGLESIGEFCSHLAKLDLTRCKGVNENGLIAYAATTKSIVEIILKQTQATEQVLTQFIQTSPALKLINCIGASITLSQVANLRKDFRNVEIIA